MNESNDFNSDYIMGIVGGLFWVWAFAHFFPMPLLLIGFESVVTAKVLTNRYLSDIQEPKKSKGKVETCIWAFIWGWEATLGSCCEWMAEWHGHWLLGDYFAKVCRFWWPPVLWSGMQSTVFVYRKHTRNTATQRRAVSDLKSGKLIIFPLSLGNSHWVAVTVQVHNEQGTTIIFDSLSGEFPHQLRKDYAKCFPIWNGGLKRSTLNVNKMGLIVVYLPFGTLQDNLFKTESICRHQ